MIRKYDDNDIALVVNMLCFLACMCSESGYFTVILSDICPEYILEKAKRYGLQYDSSSTCKLFIYKSLSGVHPILQKHIADFLNKWEIEI